MRDLFAEDVRQGLSDHPKYLPSRYFYDEKGDELFQQIMAMPEYYLTDAEFEVFSMQKVELIKEFNGHQQHFNLVEFGAGDGFKTKILLEELMREQANFTYVPIDISSNVLDQLEKNLSLTHTGLDIDPIVGEYFQALENLSHRDQTPKVILFLGSNIGNFLYDAARKFLNDVADRMNAKDKMLIGVDLKKDPQIILNAYNDPAGITKSFNLNLLNRINRELGGNFDLTQFKHWATYNPMNGEARSYLVSMKSQEVYIEALEASFKFDFWEPIYTEVSRKYDVAELEKLAKEAGFRVRHHFFDCKHYFVDSLWEKA